MADLSRLSPEEAVLAARILDAARISRRGSSHFTPLLNEREQMIAQAVICRDRLDGCLLWGGYPDAIRKMLGVFPDWQQPEEAQFPIAAVTIWLPRGAQVSHRDVLGALMGLRIGRECIGDILPAQNRCDVFVQQHLTALIAGELKKIGRYGVRCETGVPGEYVREDSFQEIRGTVASPRMDALVSLLAGISREKGAALIRAEQVQQNYRTACVSDAFLPGDVLTIRGSGKYKVDAIGPPTKKGRLPVTCKKYL